MRFIESLTGFAATIANPLPTPTADQGRIQLIFTTFFSVLAAIALLVVVIAGLRYVNSSGDPTTMSKTKNTIIYASIGLIVSLTAVAMVTFVLGEI